MSLDASMSARYNLRRSNQYYFFRNINKICDPLNTGVQQASLHSHNAGTSEEHQDPNTIVPKNLDYLMVDKERRVRKEKERKNIDFRCSLTFVAYAHAYATHSPSLLALKRI
jgi:hypothetical protein